VISSLCSTDSSGCGPGVGDEIRHAHQVAVTPVALLGRGAEGLDGPLDDADLLDRKFHAIGELLDRRRCAELALEIAARDLPLRDELDHVGRDMDRLAGVDQRPLDRLLDPPRGVGAEPGALGGVEALDRSHEPDVALLDEVGEREPAVGVVLPDRDDEAQIGADHPLAGRLAIIVDDRPPQLALLFGGEQGDLVDVIEIELKIRLQRRRPSRRACIVATHLSYPSSRRETRLLTLSVSCLSILLPLVGRHIRLLNGNENQPISSTANQSIYSGLSRS
jgi:hypothetical protein